MPKTWVSNAGRVALATCFILIYCLIQRGPLLYPDTYAYFKIGAEAARAAHVAPVEKKAVAKKEAPAGAPALSAETKKKLSYTMAGARSPYYGLPAYVLIALGSTWLLAAVQALLSAAVIFVVFRNLAGGRLYLPSMAVLAALSTLPAFAVFLMPDFVAGPTILAAVALIWRWDSLSRRDRIFLLCVVTFGCLVHSSHKVIVFGLGVLGLIAAFVLRRHGPGASRLGAGAVIGATVAALIGGALYGVVVRGLIHENIYSPPFLTARLFSAGPGRAYLQDACGKDENVFAICPFRNEPVRDSNNFLWGKDKFYQQADYATRVRMSREDKRIFVGTLKHAPMAVVRVSALASVKLLTEVGAGQMLLSQGNLFPNDDLMADLAPSKLGYALHDPRGLARIGPRVSDLIATASFLAALVAIGAMLMRRTVDRATWVPIVLFVLVALVINALVCGSLSGPMPRYQARISWLIPAVALMMAADAWRRRRATAAD